jgi:hypothetical protein
MDDAFDIIANIGKPKLCPAPGIYPNVPADEYRKWRAWNWSTLKNARRCMEHVQYAYENPDDADRAEHFVDGDLFHKYLLQPVLVEAEYALRPAMYPTVEKLPGQSLTVAAGDDGVSWTISQGRGGAKQEWAAKWDGESIVGELPADLVAVVEKKWNANAGFCRAWEAQQAAKGRQVVTVDRAEAARKMAARLREFPSVVKFIDGANVELSIVWDDAQTGLRCKARLDAERNGQIVDAKSTAKSADHESFARTVSNFGYAGQAAMYRDGLNAAMQEAGRPLPEIPLFRFLVAEGEPPFTPAVYDLFDVEGAASKDWFDFGRQQWHGYLQQVAYCIRNRHWPGYCNQRAGEPPEPTELTVPEWLRLDKLGD